MFAVMMMFATGPVQAAVVHVDTNANYVMLVSKDVTNFPVVLIAPGGVDYNDSLYYYTEGNTLPDCIRLALMSGWTGSAMVDNTHLIEQAPTEMRGVRIVAVSSVGYVAEDKGGVAPGYVQAFPAGNQWGFTQSVPVGAVRPLRMSPWSRVVVQKPVVLDEFDEPVDPSMITLQAADLILPVTQGPGTGKSVSGVVKALLPGTASGIANYGQFAGQKTATGGVAFVTGSAAQRIQINLLSPLSEVLAEPSFVDGQSVDLVFDSVQRTGTMLLALKATVSSTQYVVIEWGVGQ